MTPLKQSNNLAKGRSKENVDRRSIVDWLTSRIRRITGVNDINDMKKIWTESVIGADYPCVTIQHNPSRSDRTVPLFQFVDLTLIQIATLSSVDHIHTTSFFKRSTRGKTF